MRVRIWWSLYRPAQIQQAGTEGFKIPTRTITAGGYRRLRSTHVRLLFPGKLRRWTPSRETGTGNAAVDHSVSYLR